MTELGIKCPLVYLLLVQVTSLISLPFMAMIVQFLTFPSTCLFTFCNIIITGEPTCTVSKERMVP